MVVFLELSAENITIENLKLTSNKVCQLQFLNIGGVLCTGIAKRFA